MERRLFLILLALTALMVVGCNIEPPQCYSIYNGDKWDILKMDNSIYIMIPKYEEYHEPCTLKIETKVTVASARNAGKRK